MLALLLCLLRPAAAGAQVDEAAFAADVAALVAQPTRAPGTQGYYNAATYLQNQLKDLPNVQLRDQRFPLVVPITDSAAVTVAGRPATAIYPMWPAGVRLNATPAEGITGRLVYCGTGDLKDIVPATLDGQIAVLETAAGDRWTTAINLGARAVLLLGSPGTDNVQLRAHDLPVPVNFPRFYLPPGPLADDLRHGRAGGPATLRATGSWRRSVAINYFALIKPPGPTAAGPGGVPPAALAITVPYDSSCLVPDLAPAASQAVQAACGLALVRELSKRPPAKPVLVCFTGGDSVAFAASRSLLMALADPPATWAAERDDVVAQRKDLDAQLARGRAVLPAPQTINPVADRTLVDRLAKIVELQALFVQDRLFEVRVRPDQETPGLRAERQALEDRRVMLSRLAFAVRQRPADLATPELAGPAADVCRLAIESLAGTADAPGGLIGDDADRLNQLSQRVDLYRWLALALGHNPDPQVGDAGDDYLLELYAGLDLTDRGYRAGPVTFGRFARSSTVADVQHYAEWLTAAEQAYQGGDPKLGWYRDVAGTVDLSPLGNALAQISWMPGTQVIPSEMGQAWGVPSLSFITLDDLRPYRDTPADTPDKIRLRPVLDQLSAVSTLLLHAWADPRFAAPAEHKSHHITLTGQVVSPSAGRPVPDLPRAGFLATVFDVNRDDLRIPSIRNDPYTIGSRRTEVQACDADGNYRFEGLWRLGDPQMVAVNAFQVRPGTGAVTACTDLGTGAGDISIYANYRDRDPDPIRSLVFNCAEFSLAGLYDPRYLQDLTDVLPLDARRNAEPQRFNLLVQRQLLAGYVESGTPLYLLMRYGRVGNRLILINLPADPGDVPAESAGRGYTPDQLDRVGLLSLATARDFWRLDDLRLHRYARAGVTSDLLDSLHKQAGGQIAAAATAAADPAADARAVVTDADGAWANEARVYAAAGDMANDVIHAALFLLLLLVPFSFCMERLLIGTPNVYKQIAGVVAIFAVMTAALWSFHPAFQISASPLIIVLAFAIIFMSVVVIGVVYQKFDAELKRLRSGRSAPAEGASLARANVLVAAVVLGIANMRRRRFRTVLTSFTVVLVTFAVLCFTSASRYLDSRTLPTGLPSRYSGIMLRQRGFRPMTDRLVANLTAALDDLYRRQNPADHPTVVPRWWNVDPADPQDQIHVLRSKTAVVALPAMLGLSPGESRVSDVADVIGRTKFAPIDTDPDARVIYLSTATAAELGVKENDTIDVGGVDLRVAGTYDADAFDQRATTLSGEPIGPLKYVRDALDAGGKRLSDAGADDLTLDGAAESVGTYDHLSSTQFAVIPARLSQRLPHARLATVAVKLADDVEAGDPLVKLVSDDVTRRFSLALYAGFKDGVSLVVSSNLSSVSGAGQVAVPLAIAGLIIFNTMMGSIAERTREIHVYTSLGLAPLHVGALFVAEAMTYGLIGSVFGYVIGQGVGTLLLKLGWLGNVTLNYSGTSAMLTMGLVLLIVFLSALVPARLASRIAAPSIERSWRVPLPVNDRITAVLPFTINRTAAEGVLAYLADFFDAHREGSIGKFSAADVDPAGDAAAREIRTTIWLTPFDLGVRQQLVLRVAPGPFPDIYEVQVQLARLSGDGASWYRMNRSFLTELRKQFLQWRSLSPQRMAEYIEASRSLFDADVTAAPGLSPASPPAVV